MYRDRKLVLLLPDRNKLSCFKGYLREYGREQEHKLQTFRKGLFPTGEHGGDTNLTDQNHKLQWMFSAIQAGEGSGSIKLMFLVEPFFLFVSRMCRIM